MVRFHVTIAVQLVVLALEFMMCGSLSAGPLLPNVRASSSPNGRFLVLVEATYDKPGAIVKMPVQTRYEVVEAERFTNEGDRLNAPVTFWSDSARSWTVTQSGVEMKEMFWPIVSNDGQFLVLVGLGPVFSNTTALEIYRQNCHTRQDVANCQEGKLVRGYTIGELGGGTERSVMGGLPQWFAGGSMGFSADDKVLVVRADAIRVRIRLVDGAVLRGEP
jgi:hypothetical protein